MREPAAAYPELLVITHGIYNQSILLPVADGTAVITRNGFVRLSQGTPVCIDHAPVAVPAAQKNENAAEFLLLDELKSVGRLELTRPAGRKTSQDWIVFQHRALPMFVNGFRPGLEWRDFVGIRDVDQQ